MKKIAILIATAIMTVVMLAVPANAGNYNSVAHAADDAGFNDPIQVQCTYNTNRWLGLGASSTDAGKCPGGGYVSNIYVAAGTKIQCFNQYGTEYRYAATGWVYVPSNVYLNCYNQLA